MIDVGVVVLHVQAGSAPHHGLRGSPSVGARGRTAARRGRAVASGRIRAGVGRIRATRGGAEAEFPCNFALAGPRTKRAHSDAPRHTGGRRTEGRAMTLQAQFDPHMQLRALYQALLTNQDCFDEFKRLLQLLRLRSGDGRGAGGGRRGPAAPQRPHPQVGRRGLRRAERATDAPVARNHRGGAVQRLALSVERSQRLLTSGTHMQIQASLEHEHSRAGGRAVRGVRRGPRRAPGGVRSEPSSCPRSGTRAGHPVEPRVLARGHARSTGSPGRGDEPAQRHRPRRGAGSRAGRHRCVRHGSHRGRPGARYAGAHGRPRARPTRAGSRHRAHLRRPAVAGRRLRARPTRAAFAPSGASGRSSSRRGGRSWTPTRARPSASSAPASSPASRSRGSPAGTTGALAQ